MKNIRVKTLLHFVGIAIVILILAIGGLGYYATQRSVTLLEDVLYRSAKHQVALSSLIYRMETNRSQVLQALQHNPDQKYATMHDHPLANHLNTIKANTSRMLQERDALLGSLRTAETRAEMMRWIETSQGLGQDMIASATSAIGAGDWERAQQVLIQQINPGFLKGQQAYEDLQAYMHERDATRSIELHSEIDFLERVSLLAILVAVLTSIAAAVYLGRTISVPLQSALALARRVADGDLSATIEVDSRNEFGELLCALRDMTASLSSIVAQVRSGSNLMTSAANDIAAGNMDLSARTEQQASALEETAASIEELTGTVRQNADNARQANSVAANASSVALRGGAVVAQVVTTMNEINASSRQIVDIIAVIDGIAFQTNILALNAAVEAARAGEQGRGFAVVASEVRNLAQRSSHAAKEIKELITSSVDKVSNGSQLVGRAGSTMEEIVEHVQRVAAIMGEMTVASTEQRAGIEQIHQAISQMDQVTQQNAALVEQAASAAQSLQENAVQLSQQVSVFKITPPVRAALPALQV